MGSSRQPMDLTGHVYGNWTVVRFLERRRGNATWECRCVCGKLRPVSLGSLRGGNSSSCSCVRVKNATLPNGGAAKNRVIDIYKRGAIMRGLEWSLTDFQFMELIRQNCFYCGAEPGNVQRAKGGSVKYSGVDRKDNSKGYTEENSVACCTICNAGKRHYSYETWLAYLRRLRNCVSSALLEAEFLAADKLSVK